MSTEKRLKVLNVIKEYKIKEGTYPTLNQLANILSLKSASTVHKHICELIDEGLLVKSELHNGYDVLNIDNEVLQQVPLLGYIRAGSPVEAIENAPQTYIKLTRKSNNPGELYALKVSGDSMIGEGIFDGDIVVIKSQNYAYDGQTVVAIIDNNQATLKKLYREKKGYRLQPANQSMLPLFRDEVEVRGIIWEIIQGTESKTDKPRDSRKKLKPLKTLDLFAGVGGIRIGFERAGFATVFSNDFEKQCKYTYDLNFSNSKLVVEDITRIEAKDLPYFDFLLGGFPCQAFSVAGYRKGFEDERGRGNLFFDIVRIIKARMPTGFLLENVKNLKSHDGGNTFKVITETLEALGYHIKYKVLNSMDYGNIPQNRERIYIVGFKEKRMIDKFDFPDPIPLGVKIVDLLDEEVDEKYYYNSKPLYERLKDEVNEIGQVYQWRRHYVRKNKRGVSPTLTANMGMGGHNVPIIYDGRGIRKLTPRECFRIQGFSDDFHLPKNLADSRLYKQAGNSVSVPVIERIAREISKAYYS